MIDPNTKAEIVQLIQSEIKNSGEKSQYNVADVPAHTHNGIDSFVIPYLLSTNSYLCVAVTTNGTTAVNVFSAFGSFFNGTITGIFVVAQDATAGNITISNGGSTVVTIAKGTTSGGMTGGVSLANTTLRKKQSLTAVSSSAGNATVFVVFKVTS